MVVLRGMGSANGLMSCRSAWATSEPRISTLGGILTLGTPPADRSTADCPLLLTVAALSHSLASSTACSQAATWLYERSRAMAQQRGPKFSRACGARSGDARRGTSGGKARRIVGAFRSRNRVCARGVTSGTHMRVGVGWDKKIFIA